MYVRLALPLTVPESTATVARSVFQCGSPYLRLRDALTPVFLEDRFVTLFSDYDQTAESPWRLALITMLQFIENLSDRRASHAVQSRIDWKYLLGLELSDPGFNPLVLSEFRSRLVAGNVEAQLLDMLLVIIREQQLLSSSEPPSTKLLGVLTAVCAVDRLGYVIEALQAARHALARYTPEELGAQNGPVWAEQHVRPVDDYQIPKGDKARVAYATQIGRDAYVLMDDIIRLVSPTKWVHVPSLDPLRNAFWKNYCMTPDAYRVVAHGSAPKKPSDWVNWLPTDRYFPRSFHPADWRSLEELNATLCVD